MNFGIRQGGFRLLLVALLAGVVSCQSGELSDFVAIADEIPDIVIEARYATPQNFMGRQVPGYSS